MGKEKEAGGGEGGEQFRRSEGMREEGRRGQFNS